MDPIKNPETPAGQTGAPGTSPGTSPGGDHEAIAKLVAAAVAEANKPLLEALGKLAPAATPAAGADPKAPKAVTLADVQALLSQRDQAAAQGEARAAFVGAKMKDLPAAYRALLPQTDDAEKLAAAEQKIRQQYQADFAASPAGAAKPTIDGAAGTAGSAAVAPTIDTSKLNTAQLIAAGVQASKPTRTPPAAPAAPAAPGAGAAAPAPGAPGAPAPGAAAPGAAK